MILLEENEFPKCNKLGHNEEKVNALCLRVGCNITPAQCQFCTFQFHSKCINFSCLLKDIPKLIEPYNQIQSWLLMISKNDNELLKQLSSSIDQQLQPISKYFEAPNLKNLNHLGVYLKKDSVSDMKKQVILTQKKIKQIISNSQQKISKIRKQVNKGNEFFELKEYRKAMDYYNKAIKIDSNQQTIWLNKGNELFELKEYSKAMNYYEQAIKFDLKNQTIWLSKGNELFELNEFDWAAKFYKEAIKSNPNDQLAII